ncbi:sterol desaturase family protein [Oleiharenicola sp. Vm1]|uniref:sterol desaturase family protein n=1 Tax=Oleiharenicola sp. Vm1 TaxID=3398393 RepID=UPI0039F5CF0B
MKIVLFALSAGAVAALTYLVTTLVQVVFHRWFGHEDRLHAVFVNHARGHHADYRAGRLRSERYIEAERHVMWYYALPLVPLTALVAWLLPWSLVAVHVVALGATIAWHLHLHAQYHLFDSPWARFAWFRRKRELHLRHHVRQDANYAIVAFFWDRLLGTLDRQPAEMRRR